MCEQVSYRSYTTLNSLILLPGHAYFPSLSHEYNPNFTLYRMLQDRVDKLEADKESLVNHIYDLRQLLQKVNTQGEAKIHYIKNKSANNKAKITALLQALEISRKNASHFSEVYSYWSYCVNSRSYNNKDSLFADEEED